MRTGRRWLVQRMRAHPADRGSISLLSLGWIVVVLVALLVVAAATQAHVDRLRLTSLADEMAVVAAGTAIPAAYYAGERAAGSPGLTSEELTAAAHEWLASDSRDWASEVRLVHARTADGATVEVVISREVMPLLGETGMVVLGEGFTLTATGSARAR